MESKFTVSGEILSEIFTYNFWWIDYFLPDRRTSWPCEIVDDGEGETSALAVPALGAAIAGLCVKTCLET